MISNEDLVKQGVPLGATVAEYVSRKWGRAVRTVPPVSVSVANTVTQLCKNNPRRFTLTILNLSVSDAYEMFNDSVSPTQGFRIPAGGGSLVFSADEDGELVTYDHWAMMPAGPLNLIVIEVETI